MLHYAFYSRSFDKDRMLLFQFIYGLVVSVLVWCVTTLQKENLISGTLLGQTYSQTHIILPYSDFDYRGYYAVE